MKKKFIFVLCLIFTTPVASEEVPDAYLQITRKASQEWLKPVPNSSFIETLNFSGVDMQSRGRGDVQSDVSIRGANFEQTEIILDGVKMNDPQTGHHNMDIPLTPGAVSEIKVDRTRGGGIIELDTGARRKKSLTLGAVYGDYFTGGANVNAYLDSGKTGYLFNLSRKRANGYYFQPAGKDINDYDISNFFLKAFTASSGGLSPTTLYAGYTSKAFGAYDFYTPYRNYSSRENTKAEFLRADFSPTDFLFSSIYIRRHRDIFILMETSPDVYKNNHISDIYGLITKISGEKKEAGFEGVYESIDSTGTKGGLGNRTRAKISLFGHYDFLYLGFGLKPELKVEYNNFTNSSEILPALYVRKDLRNDLEFHFIVNRSYRLPSFTELYYEDLVNKGDSGLKSESSWNFTGGASFPVCKYFRKLSCDLFLREESNLIDWLETSAKSNKYNAVNIGSVKRQGVELRGTFKLSPLTLYAGYNFIENATGSLLLSGRNSKYALRNPVHHTFAQASVDLPFGVKNNWNAVYKDRKGEKPYTVVSADFSKKYSDFNVSLSILNVFDAAYEEILGVTQAGRRVELNVTYTLF